MLKNLIPRICRINVTPQAATMDSSSIIPALLHIMEYRRNRANTRTVVTVRITLYDVTALIYCEGMDFVDKSNRIQRAKNEQI